MRAPLSAIAILSSSCAAALALSACANLDAAKPTEQEEALAVDLSARSIVPATEDERAAIERQDLLTQAAFWAEAYELNPGDREAATKLSQTMRRIGRSGRAAQVARQGLALFPDDPDLQAAYGMALVEEGRGERAIEPLSRAARERSQDWPLLNALGVAYEQAGRTSQARARFEQALALAPDEPKVVSNLALSHALAGDADRAEAMLRRAMNQDSAGPEVRQNLALVLALQGEFAEAERIALIDTSPETAERNMAYIRSMLSSPRRWDSLNEAGLRGSN